MEDWGCTVNHINWIADKKPDIMKDVLVKVRYRNKGVMARMEPLEDGKYHLLFSDPVTAVTPGQSAVFF